MTEKVLKLLEPFKYGKDQYIEELVVQKPKAKHIRNLPAEPNTGDLLNLAGKLCGQPPSLIDELAIPDTMALLEIVSDFMDVGQKTGSQD
jgi:hypothetical protein